MSFQRGLSRKIYFAIFLLSVAAATATSARAGLLGITEAQYKKYVSAIERQGDTTPAAELKEVLFAINKNLDSPLVSEARKTNRTLNALLRMYEISLPHLNLKFLKKAKKYPYPIPFKEPMPFRYSMNAVEDGLDILKILEETVPGFKTSPELKVESGERTWFDILPATENRIYHRNPEKSVVSDISDEALKVVAKHEDFFENSVDTYTRLHQRLVRKGENASFGEFADTVDHLEKALEKPELLELCDKNPILAALRRDLLARFAFVKNPALPNPLRVARKATGPYPYRISVETAQKATRFFDIVERTKYAETADFQAVERSWFIEGQKRLVNEHYHYDRYAYHWISVAEDPDLVMNFTHRVLSFDDLIDSRVAPFAFLGAEVETVRADRYFFTPYDFWFHDLNHIRRMSAYTKNYMRSKGIKTTKQAYAFYKKVELQAKGIRKAVETLDLAAKYTAEESQEIKKLMKVLLFETLHETALNYDTASIAGDILKVANTPQPFEFMSFVRDADKLANGERLVDGNLVSGVQHLVNKFDGNPIYVSFIRDKALSLLSEVTNKLNYGFYDSVFDLNEKEFGKVQFRTAKYVAAAAEELLPLLGVTDVTKQQLFDLANSRVGMEELYKAHYGIHQRELLRKKYACQNYFEQETAEVVVNGL